MLIVCVFQQQLVSDGYTRVVYGNLLKFISLRLRNKNL